MGYLWWKPLRDRKWIVEWNASRRKFNKFNKARGSPPGVEQRTRCKRDLGCERPVLNQNPLSSKYGWRDYCLIAPGRIENHSRLFPTCMVPVTAGLIVSSHLETKRADSRSSDPPRATRPRCHLGRLWGENKPLVTPKPRFGTARPRRFHQMAIQKAVK